MPRTSFTTPKIAAPVGPYSSAEAVLEAAEKSFADVVRVGVYLTDAADYPTLNAIYARQFDKPHPARTSSWSRHCRSGHAPKSISLPRDPMDYVYFIVEVAVDKAGLVSG